LGGGLFCVRQHGGEFPQRVHLPDAEGGECGFAAVALSALRVFDTDVFECAVGNVVDVAGALQELWGADFREVFFGGVADGVFIFEQLAGVWGGFGVEGFGLCVSVGGVCGGHLH
jgi:hypothetical protein